MKDHVKILLMGDDGVGKSSLLSAYISRHFPQEVPAVMTDAMIPPETTANNVCVTIMDSSSKLSERDALKQKIVLADSIIALYDVTRPETFDSLVQDWLPLIKEVLQEPQLLSSSQLSGGGGGVRGNKAGAAAGGGGRSSLSTSASTGGNQSGHALATLDPNSSTNLPASSRLTTSTSSLPPSTNNSGNNHSSTSSGNAQLANSSTSSTMLVNKPVIVLGTKVDLLSEDEDVDKLHALLESFPFVLLCWRCSAAKLQDVDQVFYFGELLVTFPLHPIFDVLNHEFTPACRYAFQRIFRIFDLDGDNVLSDQELCESQLKCFDLAINQEELLAMKRQISKMVVGGIANNRVTFEGFLGLIKMIIENHQFQIPWTILRRFDYNDDLQLMIPKEVLTPPVVKADQITELSEGAKAFLLSLAKNAYIENAKPMKADSDSCSEIEDCLTWEALKSILAVLPTSTLHSHPWSGPPSYKSKWLPSSRIEQSVLLTGLSHPGANMTFDAWCIHWNLLALTNPILVQQLLYELGYAERYDLGISTSSSTIANLFSSNLTARSNIWSPFSFFSSKDYQRTIPTRTMMKVCILGDNRVGKSSFVWYVSQLRPPGIDEEDVEKGIDYEKPLESIVVGGCMMNKYSSNLAHSSTGKQTGRLHEGGFVAALSNGSNSVHGSPASSNSSSSSSSAGFNKNAKSSSTNTTKDASNNTSYYIPDAYQVSFAAIPLEHMNSWKQHGLSSCDLAILMFQCGDMESLETVMKLEKELPPRMPRLYVASKYDLLLANPIGPNGAIKQKELIQSHELVLQTITLHVQEHHLPPVIMTSTVSHAGIEDTMESIRSIMLNPMQAIPLHERKEKDSSYRKPLILFTAAIGIASMSYLAVKYNDEIKTWFQKVVDSSRSWFALPTLTNGNQKLGF